MWIGIVLTSLIGIALYVLATAVYNGKLEYIHEYHWKNVKEEDRLKYGRRIGRGLSLMSVSMFASIVSQLRQETWTVIIVQALGIVAGFIFFHKAQKEYNGGWFS